MAHRCTAAHGVPPPAAPTGAADAPPCGTSSPPQGGRALHSLLVEPRRPAWVREHPRAPWFVVGAVCIGAFMGQLDASIVSIAFPTLERVFHTGVAQVAWVGLSYLATLVGVIIAVGRLADMVGRKLLYCYGFVVFIAGSALCGLAPSLGLLDAARVLQAVGAAMLQANSVAIIAHAVPRGTLGRAIGVQGAAQAVGLALGPSVGGALISAGGWRLIFFVNVPAGLAGAILAWVFVPRSRGLQAREAFDVLGLSLFLPGVVCLLAGISLGPSAGWASPPILAGFAAAATLLCAFLLHERRVRSPMLDLSLFRRAPFGIGVAGGSLSYAVMFGALFLVPFLEERTRHLPAGQAGLELSALPVALGVVAPLAGRVADRHGTHTPSLVGMAVCVLALAALALFPGGSAALAAELALLGAGLGAFVPTNNASIMEAAPRSQSGAASGILNTGRGLGTALGLAISGAVLAASAGSNERPLAILAGYRASMAVLALVAGAALLLTSLRRPSPGEPSGP